MPDPIPKSPILSPGESGLNPERGGGRQRDAPVFPVGQGRKILIGV